MTTKPPKAPRPGIGNRIESANAASQVLTLNIRGDEFTLALGAIPASERIAVRRATGLPFEAFLGEEDKLGLDSVMVIWWLARRASGERNLSWAEAEAQFPMDLAAGDLTVEVDDPAGDDPEA